MNRGLPPPSGHSCHPRLPPRPPGAGLGPPETSRGTRFLRSRESPPSPLTPGVSPIGQLGLKSQTRALCKVLERKFARTVGKGSFLEQGASTCKILTRDAAVMCWSPGG